MRTAYTVKTSAFEGPLPLLLEMIEREKLPISHVSLARVTDEYVAHVENVRDTHPAELAQFIFIASTLLLIKSLSLIPNLALSEDEERDIAELEARLATYQRLKELSVHVSEAYGKDIIFPGGKRSTLEVVFSPADNITLQTLRTALLGCLADLPVKNTMEEATVQKVVSLEEVISRLYERIKKELSVAFGDFSGYRGEKTISKEERINVIVSFLALLELVKQETVRVSQERHFEDMIIERGLL